MTETVHPRQLRLHLELRDGTLRTLAQVIFSASDASLYLVPYSRNGEYYYGEHRHPAGRADVEVKFKDQVAAMARPKLSIHESGDVHIYANDSPKAGPLRVRNIKEFRGEHIASVQCDHINLLPVHAAPTRITRGQADVAVGVPDDVDAGVLCIYANGERNLFRTEQLHFARPVRCRDGSGVWYGFGFYARDAMGPGDDGGVTVLAGFERYGPSPRTKTFCSFAGSDAFTEFGEGSDRRRGGLSLRRRRIERIALARSRGRK